MTFAEEDIKNYLVKIGFYSPIDQKMDSVSPLQQERMGEFHSKLSPNIDCYST
jgi:hypothetical protein